MSTTTLEERDERIARALSNPAFFAEVYVAPLDPNWTSTLPSFGLDMLRFAVSTERAVVQLPPEFLKSTLLSQVLPLWLTFRSRYFDQQLRGMLMSEEEGMAAANLNVVAWHILNNEDLQRDFADSTGKPLVRPSASEGVWREDAIVIDRAHPSRDPTWQAKGLDSKGIHGRRLDVFIGDDLITPRNASSPAMRKKALDVFDLQVETRLVRGAKALVTGNFNDSEDLLSTLSKRQRWATFRRPSLHMPGKPDVAPRESQFAEAEELWPENWDRERLMVEYHDKPNRFRRIHLLDPRAEYGERLNTGWVDVIDKEATPLEEAHFFMAVDPAPGGAGPDLDYCSIAVGALHGANLDLVMSFDVRAPAPRQVDLLASIHDGFQRLGYGVRSIGVAKVALDRYFRGAVVIKRPDLDRKLDEVSTAGPKVERIEALGPYAQSGWLRVWESAWSGKTSDPADRSEELTLHEQWRDFPHGSHDDKLDSLDVLIRLCRAYAVMGDRHYKIEIMAAD